MKKVYCPKIQKYLYISDTAPPYDIQGHYICDCGGTITRNNEHTDPVVEHEKRTYKIPNTKCTNCSTPTNREVLGVFVCNECHPPYEINYCTVCRCKQVHHFRNIELQCCLCGTINPRDKIIPNQTGEVPVPSVQCYSIKPPI